MIQRLEVRIGDSPVALRKWDALVQSQRPNADGDGWLVSGAVCGVLVKDVEHGNCAVPLTLLDDSGAGKGQGGSEGEESGELHFQMSFNIRRWSVLAVADEE